MPQEPQRGACCPSSPRGKAPAGAGLPAELLLREGRQGGQLWCGTASPSPTTGATLAATLVPGGSGKCLAPSLA